MTADGSNDKNIVVEGVKGYDFCSPCEPILAANAVGGEDPGTDTSDSEPSSSEGLDAMSDEDDLDSIIPIGLELMACPPSADITAALIGRKIVFRWNALGWAVGTVTHFHALAKGGAKNLNFYVYYAVDGEGEDHHLSTVNYNGSADAPHGSWALLSQASAQL
jgi:hypothetical protein